MKTNRFFSATIAAILLFFSVSLFAQHQPMGHRVGGLKFTEEQKAKMKEIHMASYKEIKGLRNQVGELKAKQHTLTTADKPDMNAINANIDEITKVQNKMMKIKASTHQQIRALLTDEQKMQFDSHMMYGKGQQHKMRMHKDNQGEERGDMHHDGPQQM